MEPSWAIADKINISTDYPEIHILSDHNEKMIDITNFGQDIECNMLFCCEYDVSLIIAAELEKLDSFFFFSKQLANVS